MTQTPHIPYRPARRLLVAVLALLSLASLFVAPQARAAEGDGGPGFVQMSPISFTVFGDDNKVAAEVTVSLALALKPGVQEATVRLFEPQLDDRILPVLSKLWAAAPSPANISATTIKQTLMPVVTGVAGKDKVDSILILDIQEVRRG